MNHEVTLGEFLKTTEGRPGPSKVELVRSPSFRFSQVRRTNPDTIAEMDTELRDGSAEEFSDTQLAEAFQASGLLESLEQLDTHSLDRALPVHYPRGDDRLLRYRPPVDNECAINKIPTGIPFVVASAKDLSFWDRYSTGPSGNIRSTLTTSLCQGVLCGLLSDIDTWKQRAVPLSDSVLEGNLEAFTQYILQMKAAYENLVVLTSGLDSKEPFSYLAFDGGSYASRLYLSLASVPLSDQETT